MTDTTSSMFWTDELAVAALERVQTVVMARDLDPADEQLIEAGKLVVAALRARDLAALEVACSEMIRCAEAMPRGSFVWETRREEDR